ncbi:hypothetical protein DFJ73DRAFT_768736 [Zopfochytrium polystomum]|nr:hypothetical protein DFJ73DRAFT_768736 [Zopfochytrium polystomum]
MSRTRTPDRQKPAVRAVFLLLVLPLALASLVQLLQLPTVDAAPTPGLCGSKPCKTGGSSSVGGGGGRTSSGGGGGSAGPTSGGGGGRPSSRGGGSGSGARGGRPQPASRPASSGRQSQAARRNPSSSQQSPKPAPLYRAISAEDKKNLQAGKPMVSSSASGSKPAPGKGNTCTDCPNGGAPKCPTCHVGNQHQVQSDWISTTKSKARAEFYNNKGGGHGIVEIDKSKLGRTVDMTKSSNVGRPDKSGDGKFANNKANPTDPHQKVVNRGERWGRMTEEVLVHKEIPASACKMVNGSCSGSSGASSSGASSSKLGLPTQPIPVNDSVTICRLKPSAEHQHRVTDEKQHTTDFYNIRHSTSIYNLQHI